MRVAREGAPVAPRLAAGSILLFDYRCLHRGLANVSDEARPIAYVVYSAAGARDVHNFPAEASLRDYCERVAARNARLDECLAEYERLQKL